MLQGERLSPLTENSKMGRIRVRVFSCIIIYPALLSPRPPVQTAESAAPGRTAVSGCLRSSGGPPSERELPPSAPASDAPPGPGKGNEREGGRAEWRTERKDDTIHYIKH